MGTNTKKTFTVLEKFQEEKYIEEMARKGHRLVGVDTSGHRFEDSTPIDGTCIIEYFSYSFPKENKIYEDQGLRLVSSFKGSKGYWNYFFGPKVKDLSRRKDSYDDLLDNVLKRKDIFWNVISLSVSLFGLYMYYNSKNPIFFILVLLPLVIFFMLKGVSTNIKINKSKKGGE